MAIGYDEWIRRTGKPRNAQSALQWKTTHGVELGKYNPDGSPVTPLGAPPAAPPTPDPFMTPEGFGAAADPNAQSSIADLLAEYTTQTGGTVDASGNFVPGATKGTLGAGYGQLINNLAARRPQIEQARNDRLTGITQDMAGRGLLRSGIRETENTRANADALGQLGEVERGIQDAGTNYGLDLSNAAGRLLRGRQDIENRSNAGYLSGRLSDFRNAYGGAPEGTDVVPVPVPKAAKVTKKLTRFNSGIAKPRNWRAV